MFPVVGAAVDPPDEVLIGVPDNGEVIATPLHSEIITVISPVAVPDISRVTVSAPPMQLGT